jgi:PAS domain S-box-containing protein
MIPSNGNEPAIICQSLKGVILSWSPGAERIFGYTAEEAIGQNLALLQPAQQQMQESMIFHRLTAGEKISRHKAAWRAKDGRDVEIFLSVSLLYDDLGRISGVTQMALPVTQDHQAVQGASGASAGIDWAHLSQLRHDVRSPLNAVLGIATILPAAGPHTPRQQEIAKALKSSAADLHERLEELFRFLQPENVVLSDGAGGGASLLHE